MGCKMGQTIEALEAGVGFHSVDHEWLHYGRTGFCQAGGTIAG